MAALEVHDAATNHHSHCHSSSPHYTLHNHENFCCHPLPPPLAASLQPPPLNWSHYSHRHHMHYQSTEGIGQIPSTCDATAQSFFRQLNFVFRAPPLPITPSTNTHFTPKATQIHAARLFREGSALGFLFGPFFLVNFWFFDGFQLKSLCPHRELLT